MAEEKNPSETVPGGKYIQGDVYVNAHGEIIGKVNEKDDKKETEKEEVKK
jgi:hypothetical protein